MTLEQAKDALLAFRFTGGLTLWRAELSGRITSPLDAGDPALEVTVALHVPPRDAAPGAPPQELRLTDSFRAATLQMLKPEQWLMMVELFVFDSLRHEINEGVLVNGVRVRDPHDTKRGGWT